MADTADTVTNKISNGDDLERGTSSGARPESGNSTSLRKSTKSKEEVVNELITRARILGAITLDISGKQIAMLPDEILQLGHIQYLYMEGNKLTEIPSELFEALPELKWLDVRNNELRSLPASIGSHRHLKTLIVDGNQLKELPAELGMLETLTGLHIHDNPLEFPPPKVVARGVKEIMRYLREALSAKTRKLSAADLEFEDLRIDDTSDRQSSSSSDEFSRSRTKSGKRRRRVFSGQSRSTVTSDPSDIEFPRPKSVNLHRPISYDEYRKLQYDRFKKAGALGILGKDRRKNKQKQRIPSPPTIDPIESRIIEERRLAQLKELKQKQMLIEQRRRDQELLLNWRDETRELQRKHYIRALQMNKEDFFDPLSRAPYDTDPAYMKIMTKEDRIKQEVRNRHEALKNMLSPRSKQRLDESRIAREKELEERIKTHTKIMRERRQQPKGTPQEEMAAAKKELEMAEALHRDLNSRRVDLEYRFKAFTGDVSPVP